MLIKWALLVSIILSFVSTSTFWCTHTEAPKMHYPFLRAKLKSLTGNFRLCAKNRKVHEAKIRKHRVHRENICVAHAQYGNRCKDDDDAMMVLQTKCVKNTCMEHLLQAYIHKFSPSASGMAALLAHCFSLECIVKCLHWSILILICIYVSGEECVVCHFLYCNMCSGSIIGSILDGRCNHLDGVLWFFWTMCTSWPAWSNNPWISFLWLVVKRTVA